jgi:hypothetical protein
MTTEGAPRFAAHRTSPGNIDIVEAAGAGAPGRAQPAGAIEQGDQA